MVQTVPAAVPAAAGNVVGGSGRTYGWTKGWRSVGRSTLHRVTWRLVPLCETALAPAMISVTFYEELCQPQWEEVKLPGLLLTLDFAAARGF